MRYLFHPFLLLFYAVVLILAAVEYQNRSIERECAQLMTGAHTSRDTLDVRLTCARLHSDANTAMAIGAAAGFAAGASAGTAAARSR